MAGASIKNNLLVLDWVLCIHYPIWFKKSKVQIQVLINSSSEVNAMTSIYALKLGLKIHPTKKRAQKIDGFTFKTFEMILASFQMKDTLEKARFFLKNIFIGGSQYKNRSSSRDAFSHLQ